MVTVLEVWCSMINEDVRRHQFVSDSYGGSQAACVPSYVSTSVCGRRHPVSIVELVIGLAIPLFVHYSTVRGGRQPASPCASLLSFLPPMWPEIGYELVQTCLRAEGRRRQPGSLPVFMLKTYTHFICLDAVEFVWSQAARVPPILIWHVLCLI